MRKFVSFLVVAGCAVFAAMVAHVAPALAAGTVEVPIGSWVENVASFGTEIIFAAVAFALRKVPSSLTGLFQALRVDQLLERAVDYGLNAVVEATRGKTLNLETGSAVLGAAVQYAVNMAPTLVAWAGGEDAIRAKIFARLQLAPDVSADAMGVTLN